MEVDQEDEEYEAEENEEEPFTVFIGEVLSTEIIMKSCLDPDNFYNEHYLQVLEMADLLNIKLTRKTNMSANELAKKLFSFDGKVDIPKMQ